MNDRVGRAFAAKSAFEDYLDPMFAELIEEYTSRLVEIANSELDPKKRAEKITALSIALKITRTLKDGMLSIISDGDVVAREKVRAERLEGMTASQRRLLGIVPV